MDTLIGPDTITVMNKEDRKVILISDIHTREFEFDIPTDACLKLANTGKKIDYFIEMNYDDINNPGSAKKPLYTYSRCINSYKQYFNPFLVDYRHKLPQRPVLTQLITLFSLPSNSKVSISALNTILINIQSNIDSLYSFNHVKLLKKYFDIVNEANGTSVKPDKSLLKYYIKEFKQLETKTGGIKKLTNDLLDEMSKLETEINNTKSNSLTLPVKFQLTYTKLFSYLLQFEELLFDVYVLSGILSSSNDTVIIQAGYKHIKTYERILKQMGYTTTKSIIL